MISIIKDLRMAMVSTHSAGRRASRPLTLVEATDQAELWFFSAADAGNVHEIRAQGLVNVSFSGSKQWASVSCHAQVVLDVAKKKELWNAAVETFASAGPESAQTVLRIEADSAEYWENPGGARRFE